MPLGGSVLVSVPSSPLLVPLGEAQNRRWIIGGPLLGRRVHREGERFVLIRTEGSFSVKGPFPMDTRCRVRVPLEEAQVEEVPWRVV